MSTPVAEGPYKGVLPFLSIEGISISPTELRLVLSNEIIRTTEASRTIDFGNFVFFSSGKSIIENLYVDDVALKEKILREQHNIRHFSLDSRADFRYKTYIDKSHDLNVAHQTYIHRHFMDLDANNTNDLYVLVVSFSEDSNNNITIGSVLKETLLISGRPPLESDLYTLTDTVNFYGEKDSIWPASVHIGAVPKGGSVYETTMAGRTHISSPHPALLSEKVINVKSKDLRILELAGAAIPAIIPPVSSLLSTGQADIDTANAALSAITGPLGYFSPLHLSRDRDGIVYGYFGFDLIDYFKDNSLFGRYIQNPEALAACIKVVDIKISRVTTKKLDIRSNKLTARGTKTGLCKIKTSGADYPFIPVGSLNDDVQIIKKFNNGEIIGIAFRDDGAAQYAAGGLEYYAQVILADNTKDVFKAISDIIQRGVTRCNLDPTECGNLVGTYMASIKFINGISAYGSFTPKEWQKVLLILTSDFSPESRGHIINALIRGYGLALEAILNTNNATTKSAAATFDSSISNVDPPLPLEASVQLNGGLEVNNPNNVGLNYIDDYLSNTGGVIPAITYQIMQQRITAEEEKFPSSTENAETTNSYGYLSPTSVALGSNPPIDTTSQNIDMGGQEALFAASSQTIDLTPTSQANANAAVISSMGISISALPVSLNRLVAAASLVTPESIASSEIMGDNASFNLDSPSQDSGGSNESVINVHQTQHGAFTAYGGNLANQLLGEEFNGFNLPTPPTPASSPQALATASPNLAALSNDTAPPPPVPTVLTFGSLVRVEYLSSYVPQGGIGAENWSILTDVVFNQAQSNSEMLICRLVKIEEGQNSTENTIFTPLSTLFIIGPLGNISIDGNYGPLLRSYLIEPEAYLSEFNSLRNAYGKEVLYSQTVPMGIATSGPPATAPPPAVVLQPNQTIPMATHLFLSSGLQDK